MHARHQVTWLFVAALGLPATSCDRGGGWPLRNEKEIWHAYGQFQNGSAPHMHKGVDIPARVGADVLAVESGRVQVDTAATDYQSSVRVTGTSGTWIYRHVRPQPGLAGRVRAGQKIGTIANHATIAPHLHVELLRGGKLDDPLVYMRGKPAKPNPASPSDLLFRDNARARPPFDKQTCAGPTVVLADVDIVAKGVDHWTRASSRVSPHLIWLRVSVGRTKIIDEPSFRFQQGSRSVPLAPFTPGLVRLTQVIYDTNAPSKSVDNDQRAPWTSQHESFIVTTNIGIDRTVIAPGDKDRAWNTDVKKSAQHWNDSGPNASNNVEAKTPDGEYDVRVFFRDENGAWGDRREKVFVNNNDETLRAASEEGVASNDFPAGTKVFVTGDGYPAGRTFNLYALAATTTGRCAALGPRPTVRVTSDARGVLPPTEFTGLGAGQYVFVLDYDGDGKRTGPREGHTVDGVSAVFRVR